MSVGNPYVNLYAKVNSVVPDLLTMNLSGPVRVNGCNGTSQACFLQQFTMHGYSGNPRPTGDLTCTATACEVQEVIPEHVACK